MMIKSVQEKERNWVLLERMKLGLESSNRAESASAGK